jgi:Family of unknown function (DUF6812)
MPKPRESMGMKKEEVEVVLFTRNFRIEGVAHFLKRARVSDFLNRPDTHFIPMTNVVVYTLGGEEVSRSLFSCVNKSEIVMMSPREE